MTNHCKIYLNHFDFVVESEVLCEVCMKPAVDIHHIEGRGKDKDVIKNLIAVCRDCHTKAHDCKISKGELQYIHNNVLQGHRKVYIKNTSQRLIS